MAGEAVHHSVEILQARFEKMGSAELESAVVQRYSIQGLQGAAGIVAWPTRGATSRDGGKDVLLDGCWVLSTQNAIVRFNPRTARQQARDDAEYARGTWAGLELLAGGSPGNVQSSRPRVQDEDGEWTSSAQFRQPEGVAIDHQGNVVVADAGNNSIRAVSRDGVVHLLCYYDRPSQPPVPNQRGIVLPVQDPLPAQCCLPPHGVCVLRDGRVVVSHGGVVAGSAQLVEQGAQLTMLSPIPDSRPSKMYRSDPQFEKRASTPQLHGAMGVAMDNDGNILVADQMDNRLARVTLGGVTTVCGGQGSEISFDKPTAVVVDRFGAMIVADWKNGRLRKVTERDGEVRVSALDWEEEGGAVLGGREAPSGGRGPQRKPFRPFALALDTHGRLLVLDSSYPSDVLVVDYLGQQGFRARRRREQTGRIVPRVRFDSKVSYREATLLQMQAALERTGMRSGGGARTGGGARAGGAAGDEADAPLTLLDLPPIFWEHTDESAVNLLRTSKTLRLALERRVPGETEPGKPTMSVRLNQLWLEKLGSSPPHTVAGRKVTVLAEVLRTSEKYSITTLELNNLRLVGTEPALATAIARSTALTRLSLKDCKIPEAGCERLAQALLPCTRLLELDLGGNQLSDGVALIANVLPRLPVLKNLTMSRCLPGGSRATGDRLALALSQCTALTRLNVKALFGETDGFPIEPLVRALPLYTALQELDLSWNICDAVAGVAAGSAGAGMLSRSLARCSGLKDLSLASCRLDDETVVQLGARDAFTALTRLNLRNNTLHEAGTRSLAHTLPGCRALRELDLSGCGNFAEVFREVGPALAQCPALRCLHVTGFVIEAEECGLFLRALRESTSLTELELQSDLPVRRSIFQEDTTSDWSIAVAAAEVLGEWPRLRKLTMSMSNVQDEHVRRLVAANALTAITNLNLSCNKLGDRAGMALAAALPTLTALTKLDLGCNDIREHGVLALISALPRCSSLTSLHLFGSAVLGNAWKNVVARLLLVLPQCPWLRELDLRSNYRSEVLARDAQRLRAAWLLATGQDGPSYDAQDWAGAHEINCAGLRLSVFTGSN